MFIKVIKCDSPFWYSSYVGSNFEVERTNEGRRFGYRTVDVIECTNGYGCFQKDDVIEITQEEILSDRKKEFMKILNKKKRFLL